MIDDSQERGDDHLDEELLGAVGRMIGEKLDVEALAQMVEQIDYSKRLASRLQRAFGGVNSQLGTHSRAIAAIQSELRDLILDVELLKRALSSLGQIGVMERRRIERELIREVFPPTRPREGAGVVVAPPDSRPPKEVDCASRLDVCKAACCRIFNAGLTPAEVESDRYDWNPKAPYSLQRNRFGCVYLQAGGCACTIYGTRLRSCHGYVCENDRRIWSDFEKRILNPALAKRLEALDVKTNLPSIAGPAEVPAEPALDLPTGTPDQAAATRERVAAELQAGSQGTNTTDSGAAMGAGDEPPDDGAERNGEPPDFSELRELVIPTPKNIFRPPVPDEASETQVGPQDNSSPPPDKSEAPGR